MWDVSQVEIYRGPQSTLSGRASLAGAIYIKTNDPTFDWQMGGQFTYGEHATTEGALMLGGPIVANRLAFRMTGEYQRSKSDLNYPLYEQFSAFSEFAEDEYYQFRGKLLLTPTALNGGRALLTYAFAHDSPLYDDIAGPGLGFEYSERRGDLNAGTPFYQANRETDNHSVSLDVTRPISDMLMFTSTTTYAFTRLDRSSINSGTPGEVYTAEGFEDQTYATQEFRLNFNSDRLQWVAGLYGAYQDSEIDAVTATFFSGGRTDTSRPTSKAYNVAAFGEVNYEFVPTWKVTVGARGDYETQEQNYFFSREYANPAFTDVLRMGTSENDGFTFLPKAAIVKEFMPGRSLGFTVQRGYRSGGAGVDPTDGSAYDFNPEYTWNFELSYRGNYFDDRMTLAANVFYTDWTDQQVEIQQIPQDFTSTVILNAGASHLYGGEIESQFRITPELSTFVAIGYVETQFDDFVSSVGVFDGMPFPEAPKWTVSVGADYNHSSGFFIGADARHVSGYLARDLQNEPVDRVGDYIIASVRAGYRAENWSITVFSDNVFDEEYFLYKDVIGTFDCCGTLGPRRVTGVTLRVTN